MAIKLSPEHLQSAKYKYDWRRTEGDSRYTGPLDRNKVSKREGYEVKVLIEHIMNKHNLKTVQDAHNIEDALHHRDLSAVVNRADLISRIEDYLRLR